MDFAHLGGVSSNLRSSYQQQEMNNTRRGERHSGHHNTSTSDIDSGSPSSRIDHDNSITQQGSPVRISVGGGTSRTSRNKKLSQGLDNTRFIRGNSVLVNNPGGFSIGGGGGNNTATTSPKARRSSIFQTDLFTQKTRRGLAGVPPDVTIFEHEEWKSVYEFFAIALHALGPRQASVVRQPAQAKKKNNAGASKYFSDPETDSELRSNVLTKPKPNKTTSFETHIARGDSELFRLKMRGVNNMLEHRRTSIEEIVVRRNSLLDMTYQKDGGEKNNNSGSCTTKNNEDHPNNGENLQEHEIYSVEGGKLSTSSSSKRKIITEKKSAIENINDPDSSPGSRISTVHDMIPLRSFALNAIHRGISSGGIESSMTTASIRSSSNLIKSAAASTTLSKMLREERSAYAEEKARQRAADKLAAAHLRRNSRKEQEQN